MQMGRIDDANHISYVERAIDAFLDAKCLDFLRGRWLKFL